MSIAWAVFAIAALIVGIWASSAGSRKMLQVALALAAMSVIAAAHA